MADLRLCNKLALRISLSFFERLGLALDRLEVPFLPADVRGSRHQFKSVANMCALRAHTRSRCAVDVSFPQDPPDMATSNP